MQGQTKNSEGLGLRDTIASQRIDYYVVLSEHIYCDFSKVSVLWLESSPANICINTLSIWNHQLCLQLTMVKTSTGQHGCGATQTQATAGALPLTTWVELLVLSLSSLLCKMRVTIPSTRGDSAK